MARVTHIVECDDQVEFDSFVAQLDEYMADRNNAPIELRVDDANTLTIRYRIVAVQKTREALAEEAG